MQDTLNTMSPIPWAAIVRYGPTLVASATRLLATADQNKLRQQNETMAARLDHLENTSVESARLLREIAEQVQVVAAAQEQTARRYRTALVLGVAATVVAIGAIILAVVW
jgi:hypothetical protein